MALKDTVNQMHNLLATLTKDLSKVGNGNKAASQRVRTGSIHFQKIAKLFRKESVQAEKSGQFKKKSKAKSGGKPAVKKKTAAKKSARKKR